MSDDQRPPTTIEEVGIHIGYMSKDITELKGIVQRLVDEAPSRKEVDDLEKRVRSLEDWKDSIFGTVTKYTVIGIVLMVLGLYGLDRFLK